MSNLVSEFRAAARAGWWMLLLRSLLLLLLAFFAFTSPGSTALSFLLVFGVVMLVEGIATFIFGWRLPDAGARWSTILSGVLSVLLGILAFTSPGTTLVAIVWVVAFWALLAGILQVVAAFRFRRVIPGAGEWLLGLSGVLLAILGVLFFMQPGAGAVTLVLLVGWYALIAGIVGLVLAFRVRSAVKEAKA